MSETPSERGCKARVQIMEHLINSGIMSLEKAEEFLPRPVSLAFNGVARDGDVYFGKPDDDFRIDIDRRTVVDRRRKANSYDVATFSYNGPLRLGQVVRVYGFDGWGPDWSIKPWAVEIGFDTGAKKTIYGGTVQTGQSADTGPYPPDYYDQPAHYFDYRFNGEFMILPPDPWPPFSFWKTEAAKLKRAL